MRPDILAKIGLSDRNQSLKKIWLSFFVVILLVGLNFQSLLIPMWAISLISVCLILYSLVSFVAWAYWSSKFRTVKNSWDNAPFILSLIGLSLIVLTNIYIGSKIIRF